MSAQPAHLAIATPEAAPAPAAETSALLALTDAQRARVLVRFAIVQNWQRFRDEQRRENESLLDALNRFHSALLAKDIAAAPSQRSIRRWTAQVEEHGIDGLIDGRGRGAAENASCGNEAWAYFKSLWLHPNQRSAKFCYDLTRERAGKQAWPWPSYGTILRRIRDELPPSISDLHRRGKRYWQKHHEPKIHRDPTEYRANENWVGDHHQFDLVCMHQGKPIRPWLTAWQDRRSRLFTGAVVCASPNSDTILAAFANGVRQHGAPLIATMDNGKDYRAKGVAGGKCYKPRVDERIAGGVMEQLGVTVSWCRPYNPGAKHIERHFAVVCERFSKLFDSYIGNKPENRPESFYADLRSDNMAVPTLAEVAQLWEQWVVSYHEVPQNGEGMHNRSPRQSFAEDEPIARRTAPDDVLDLLLMKTHRAKVTRQGVRYNGVQYGEHNSELFALRSKDVLLRIDPVDASYVLVCDLQGRFLCRAENDRIRGVTTDDIRAGHRSKQRLLKIAKQANEAKRDARKNVETHALLQAQQRLAEQYADQRQAAGAEHEAPPRNVKPIHGAESLADSLDLAKRSRVPVRQPDDDDNDFTDLNIASALLADDGSCEHVRDEFAALLADDAVTDSTGTDAGRGHDTDDVEEEADDSPPSFFAEWSDAHRQRPNT